MRCGRKEIACTLDAKRTRRTVRELTQRMTSRPEKQRLDSKFKDEMLISRDCASKATAIKGKQGYGT